MRCWKEGQNPKSATGREQEVRAPRQLRYVPNIFRNLYSPWTCKGWAPNLDDLWFLLFAFCSCPGLAPHLSFHFLSLARDSPSHLNGAFKCFYFPQFAALAYWQYGVKMVDMVDPHDEWFIPKISKHSFKCFYFPQFAALAYWQYGVKMVDMVDPHDEWFIPKISKHSPIPWVPQYHRLCSILFIFTFI